MAFSIASSDRSNASHDPFEVVLEDPHVLEHATELIELHLPVVGDVLALELQFGRQDLFLRLGGQVFTRTHRHGAGDRAGDSGEEDLSGRKPATDDTGHQEVHRDEAVVDPEDHVPPVLACLADVLLLRRSSRFCVHLRKCTDRPVTRTESMDPWSRGSMPGSGLAVSGTPVGTPRGSAEGSLRIAAVGPPGAFGHSAAPRESPC